MWIPKFIASRVILPSDSEIHSSSSSSSSPFSSPSHSSELSRNHNGLELPLHNNHLDNTNLNNLPQNNNSSLTLASPSNQEFNNTSSSYLNNNNNNFYINSSVPNNLRINALSNVPLDLTASRTLSPNSEESLSPSSSLYDPLQHQSSLAAINHATSSLSSEDPFNGTNSNNNNNTTTNGVSTNNHTDNDLDSLSTRSNNTSSYDPYATKTPSSPYSEKKINYEYYQTTPIIAQYSSSPFNTYSNYPPTFKGKLSFGLACAQYYSATACQMTKRLSKARFIIKQNITVPLWVLLLLVAVISYFTIFSLFAALFLGTNVPGSILPSVAGPPPIREINGKIDRPFVLGCTVPDVDAPRANAVLVVLARNKEMEGIVSSMQSLERHFNRWFHYPYVFLNDQEFNSTFKEAVSNATESKVEFGQISAQDWNFPQWADEEVVEEAIAQQGDKAIMYGGMASYHKMCRFYSGAFFNHPLLLKYDWYWRVEPDVKYFCDITYDPFVYMEKHNKVYGFTIIIKELVETVPNLFRQTFGFKQSHNITSQGMWELFLTKHETEEITGEGLSNSRSVLMDRLKRKKEQEQQLKENAEKLHEKLPDEAMIGDQAYEHVLKKEAGKKLSPSEESDQVMDVEDYDYYTHEIPSYSINGQTYNMCHFWSNFEIARFDFFRSKQYQDYFQTLDKSGGFWNERWGDAPVHSLAAGLFLKPSQVHYFRDIGYRHTTIQHCPANAPERQLPRTPYIPDPTDKKQIEEDKFWDDWDPEVTNGVGCRCRCDTDVVEVEGKDGSCLSDWVDLIGGWV